MGEIFFESFTKNVQPNHIQHQWSDGETFENKNGVAILEKFQKAGYSEDRIIKGSKSYFEHNNANVPELINKVGITVTYKMGWQKC